jgi:hypothetical protein
MPNHSSLTSASLLAAASEILERAGYRRVTEDRVAKWPLPDYRVYEDAYSVVAVVVYGTWAELATGWTDAQGRLVALISDHFGSGQPKAWDGYLVVITTSTPTEDREVEASRIERDTSRVRKLVASGNDIRTIADVERALLPLLPVDPRPFDVDSDEAVLSMLPRLLALRGVPEGAARELVEAYARQEPLLERLHAYRLQS